jgi:cysteine desulfurase
LLGCSPGELIFTSGATEANNAALHAMVQPGGRLIVSAVEHPAVLETARALERERDTELITLPVDMDGRLIPGSLQDALGNARMTVVSIMAANNETGVLSDLPYIVGVAHAAGALVHTDATQLIGKLPVDLSSLSVDLLSLSAHKFGGPQGIGALFVRRGLRLPKRPFLHGGGQEQGWRAGTLNVAGIVGAGAAAAACGKLQAEAERVQVLRDLLECSLLSGLAGARVNGDRQRRLPHVSSMTFDHAPADALLAAMPDVAASDGSACSSGAPTPSHVLLAMGRSRDEADSTIRFSLGYATTREDVERAIEAVTAAVTRVRAILGATRVGHSPRIDTNNSGQPAVTGTLGGVAHV